jgi:Carboxypeptidase regulatory-like domain
MNHVRSKRTIILAMILALAASFAFAQSDLGSITGFAKDPSGSVVPNAKVTVRNQSGLERQATTNEAGFYTITNIPPGTYRVSVEAAGFKKFESNENKLDPSATLTVDAALTVGAATETVEVTAQASNLQTESASLQKDVTRQQIDALELNGRNPIYMAALVPGARGGNLAGLNFNFTQGPSNFNGSRNWENLITYDGAPATRTRANGTSLGAADVDSTSEIQVLTADYAPEYGRTSGAQIRIITKSGSSVFHGSLYEYFRNNDLNANTWSRNLNASTAFVPPFHYNQFGYNIGGPFYVPNKFNSDKSKFFWYWAQEWVRYIFTDTAQWTVPSALMRQGNFSELLNPSNYFYGKAVTIKDPTTGSPFPGNIIPASQLSPSGSGVLKAYPFPNFATNPLGGNGNFYTAANHPQNQRKDTLAVDLNVTDKQRLQFRRNNYTFWEYQPLDGTPGETPKYFNRPNQTNSLDYVWTIKPNMVNEFLATVSLDDVGIPVDAAHFFDRTSVGINYPYIFPQGKLIPTRIPTAAITNFSTLTGNPYPSHSAGPIYTLSDSLTWIHGSHTVKAGFAFERSGENDNDEINVSACPTCTNNQNGQFSFTDGLAGGTGVAAANAALGLFDTYSELGQRAYTIFRHQMYEGFAQDSWKITQKLTATYGVRYTIMFPMQALWRNMSVFDPSLYDPTKAVTVDPANGHVILGANSDRYDGMVIPGTGWPSSAKGRFPESTAGTYDYLFRGGVRPPYFSNIQYNTPQPRVGFAYQVNDKTVVRSGIGRFFTLNGDSDSIFLGGNPPFQPTASVTAGHVDNPGGSSSNLLPLTVTTYPLTQNNPEAWNWNFTVERQLPWQSVASVAYVGRRGLHLPREVDINQPTTAVVAANPGVNLDALRPYKGYNSIRSSQDVATSRYNALQVTWNRRLAQGLMFGVSYTYSKSQDDGSAYRDILPDTYYAGNLWGLSSFDVTHMMVINYSYTLPFFRNQKTAMAKMLGGWQLSGITQFQTGTPCSAVVNTDYAGVGVDGNMNDCGGTGEFWNMTGSTSVLGGFAKGGNSDPTLWFQTKNPDGSLIMSAPAKGTFATGAIGRDFVHNPGLENWNIGLYKQFAINERSGFQFRCQAFDAFNHPNLAGASFNPNNLATFGKVTSKTGDVRNLQLSLRFYF